MSIFKNRFFTRQTLALIERHPLAVLMGVVAYILLPIDLLPEALMGPLGAFDDILAAIAGVAIVKAAARRREKERPVRPTPPPAARSQAPSPAPSRQDSPAPSREEQPRHRHRGRRRYRGNRPPNN